MRKAKQVEWLQIAKYALARHVEKLPLGTISNEVQALQLLTGLHPTGYVDSDILLICEVITKP